MAERTLFPSWAQENTSTVYPFIETAGLWSEDRQVRLEPGTFVDAVIHIPGLVDAPHLTRITPHGAEAVIAVGSQDNPVAASGVIDLTRPSRDIPLQDRFGRPAGLLVGDPIRLAALRSWPSRTHTFTPDQTAFCPFCCIPLTEPGLSGFVLADGTFVGGEVWLGGADGVVVRPEIRDDPVTGEPTLVIRVDVTGDPLFRRRLCEPNDLFQTPRFVRRLQVVSRSGTFVVVPDEHGVIRAVADASSTPNPALRLTVRPDGLRLELAGPSGGR